MRRLVEWYRPPDSIPPWPGLKESVDEWVAAYSKYIRSCFLRRELDERHDPAINFSRWFKDHYSVSFDHRTYSYFRVAQSVQKALQANRTVLLVMVDALPIHLVTDFVSYVGDRLGEEPTESSYIFVPVPTITDVCKQAVLTGKLPIDCRGDLLSQLQQQFDLAAHDICLAANWQDAERLQFSSDIRLVVYRDNRLDDQLHKTTCYCAMVEDSHGVFRRMGSLLQRWSSDIRCLRQEAPLILVTSDHGFTYGPSPGHETAAHRVIDGGHRCIEVAGLVDDADAHDESITVIDKDVFRLRATYLAASGRHFGKDTMSGWSMSHGGLLPEEVIVPFVEWFGREESMTWPVLTFPDGIVVDQDRLVVSVLVENVHNTPTRQVSLTISIPGVDSETTTNLPPLSPGESTSVALDFEMPATLQGDEIPVDVVMHARQRESGQSVERVEQVLVPRARRLVEKTREQSDFEDMF